MVNATTIHDRNFKISIKSSYWYTISDIRKQIEERIEENNRVPKIHKMEYLWRDIAEAIDNVRRKYYITVEKVIMEQKEIIIEGRTNEDICLDLLRNYFKTKDWVHEDGQKVLEVTHINNPKIPELHTRYKYLIKLTEK